MTMVKIVIAIVKKIERREYRKLEEVVLADLGFSNWEIVSFYDAYVTVKSRQTLEKYDDVRFFRENSEGLVQAENAIKRKRDVASVLSEFLKKMNFNHSGNTKSLKSK